MISLPRMRIPRPLLPLALVLAALGAPAQSPPLRIGTWNLEFLGCRKDHPRTEADLQRIADFVREMRVSVLACQEVCGEAPLADLARRIGPSFRSVLGTTGDWNDGKTRQSIGFVWDDSEVELLSCSEMLDLPREQSGLPVFHRVPVTACFRSRDGGVDFRAITVHFKAGQKETDEKKREIEVSLLRDRIEALLRDPAEDHDIVVLGDFNHSYDSAAAARFEQDDVVRYLHPSRLSPTIAHFDTPIDMIAVTREFDEAIEKTLRVRNERGLSDRDGWMRAFSDHFPVTVDVDRAKDRDPMARFAQAPEAFRLPRAAGHAPAGSPIAIGDVVRLVTRQGDAFRGRLLAPLGGSFVHIESDGKAIAVPLDFVAYLVRE
ncbi:MAG: hypothetical protein Fur0037_26730 [Planctomycetota bacterium]